MAITSKLRSLIGADEGAPPAAAIVPDAVGNNNETNDLRKGDVEATGTEASLKDELENPAQDAQAGVQKIEAVTLTWSMGALYTSLCMIWLITFVSNMEGTVAYSLLPYVTSDFGTHSLIPIVGIVSSAVTSAVYIPMAKALDMWGRAEGFLLMLVFALLGLVLIAVSHNLETYCAGQVFWSVGSGGLAFTWDVIAADVSSLRNRGLVFAFTSSPGLISAFAGPKIASKLVAMNQWRWGFGMWAILLPVVALPLWSLLWWNLRKAKKSAVPIPKVERKLNFGWRTIWWAIIEFDVVGVFLLAVGLVIFLLPFSLYALAPNGWKTGYIIAMIVVGGLMVISFGVYEFFFAPVPFLNRRFLVDRTVLGACLLDMTYQVSYYCYANYLTSFLQVVYYVDIETAGYIGNIFSVVSFVVLFVVGWLVRWTGRFKWILWIAVPLYIFGTGLMIHFRQPGGYIGYIVMCEIFFSAAGGTFILLVQLAVLSVVDHQHVAAVLAYLFVSGGIGDAIGSGISGAIWAATFRPALQQNLPASAQANLTLIYDDLYTQLSYPPGTETRDAINKSYGHAQTVMLASATGFMALGFVFVAMMRNINVKHALQTKGNTF